MRRKTGHTAETLGGRTAMLKLSVLASVLLLGLAGFSRAEASSIPRQPAPSIGASSQFAIADFDGDHQPDLATIQPGQNSASVSSYWIELNLSSVGQQSIQLVAPTGGLQIEARDVNGDHTIDLVLSTAWFRKPVAVFLNDGHGRFSRAEPADFPESFSGSKTILYSTSNQMVEAVAAPSQSPAGIRPEENCALLDPTSALFIPLPSSGFPRRPFLFSHSGRAPPFDYPAI